MDLPKFKEAQEAVIEKLLTAPGVHGAAYGVTKEAERDVVVLFVGWDSVEVRTRLDVSLTECLLTVRHRRTMLCARYPGTTPSSHRFTLRWRKWTLRTSRTPTRRKL